MACIFVSRILDVDHKQDLRPLSFLKNSVVSLMTLQNATCEQLATKSSDL